MSIWKKVKDAVSKPVRGIGRVAKGAVTGDLDKMRQGVGDIGAGARAAAPALNFVPGIGTIAAAGIGAAGGALERAGQKGANFGNVLGTAAKGGAQGAAGGLAKAGIGQIASGGMPGLPGLPGMGGGGAGAAASGGGGGLGFLGGIGNIAGKVGGWATSNPELAGQILGTGASMYGAHQEGKMADKQFGLTEEDMRRKWDEDERRRRVAANIYAERTAG